MDFLAAKLHERRMKHSRSRLFLIALAALAVHQAAQAQSPAESPCAIKASAPPAISETVTCSQAAISRFFLISPTMASMAADQRAEVVSHPLRYAFAYMGADAVNRLQQGFADQAVKQIDYKAILTTSDAKGAILPHQIFKVRMDRAIADKADWKNLSPQELFKLAPSHLSPWLQSGLDAEDAAKNAKAK